MTDPRAEMSLFEALMATSGYSVERRCLVAAFMAGDVDAFSKWVKRLRSRLRPPEDRHEILSAWGKKGAAARWGK